MFTGIITNVTPVTKKHQNTEGLTLTFKKPTGWNDLKLGESVATNGVCLTVAALGQDEYDCFLMPETLARTSFGSQLPNLVNLERSLSVSDRFGGHFVQGHVDGVGIVSKIDKTDGHRLYIDFDKKNAGLVIPKGSITVNGVSLTIAGLEGNNFGVALVPHTLEHTTLGALKVGDGVNLEFDMIGKYINRIIGLS